MKEWIGMSEVHIHWPRTRDELEAAQIELGRLEPRPWRPDSGRPLAVAGAFVAGSTGAVGVGEAGDPLWAAAVLVRAGSDAVRTRDERVVRAGAGAPYSPGYLALRVGRVLELAIASLDERPDVVLVDATGRDHPRRAGLALHIGAALDLPSVGVTDRALLASAAVPADEPGSSTALWLRGEVVGVCLRTRAHARPVLVHAGWRTDPETAAGIVMLVTGHARTPEPIRRARRLARQARAIDEGRVAYVPS